MARVPPLKSFRREDFPDQPWIDRLFSPLNQFLNFTVQALDRGLTFADNIKSQTRTVDVTLPDAWSVPTFSNGWVDRGSAGFAPVGYRRRQDGRVELRGLMNPGTYGSAAFTLPAGYRPAAKVILPAVSFGASVAIARVDVDSSGAVTPSSGGATWCSLAGLAFDAAPSAPIYPSPFPLSLKCDIGKPTHLFVTRAVDKAAKTGVVAGCPAWDWDGKGQVLLRDVPGLLPGRSYTLTVLFVAG